MPAVAGGFYHYGVAGNQGQMLGITEELFPATFKADFYDIETLKVSRQVQVLQPVEYVEAVTTAGAATPFGAAAGSSGGAAPTGRTR